MGKTEVAISIVAIAITLMGLWPLGLAVLTCEAIYLIVKSIIRFTTKTVYEEKEKARQKYDVKKDTKKPFTQADFERWKQDQSGFVDLAELGKLFRRRIV